MFRNIRVLLVTTGTIEIREAVSQDDLAQVRRLFEEYWQSFQFTPRFQGFAEEVAGLPGAYARPDGCLLLAWWGEEAVGCGAYRRFDESRCEGKRLYVSPNARGRHLGRLLMERLLDEARKAGYRGLVGDTLPVMGTAIKLYSEMGFETTPGDPSTGALLLRYPLWRT